MERTVIAIPKESTYPWLLEKHYAKRIPQIVHSYGVFENQFMQGVITYGIPASPSLTMGLCGEQYKDIVLELNRLCLVQGHDKNLASYFVAQTLRMLPSPSIVVSYADTSMEHVGYIYIRQLTSCIRDCQQNELSGERLVLIPTVVPLWDITLMKKGYLTLIDSLR